MNAGKVLVGLIVVAALAAGVGIYYNQVYAFYEEVPEADVKLRLTGIRSDRPEPFLASDIRAIDSESSPIRFRACFQTPMSIALLTETFQPADEPVPLIAPDWFDCFDAVEIGEALEAGRALAFLSERDIRDGVDRVIAVFPDGRGYAWHQLNEKFRDD